VKIEFDKASVNIPYAQTTYHVVKKTIKQKALSKLSNSLHEKSRRLMLRLFFI